MRQATLEQLNFVCGYLIDTAKMIREDTAKVVATGDHVEVIRHFNDLRLANKRIKESREALDELEKQLSYEDVPTVMRNNQIKTTTIEGVGRVSLSNKWSCSMMDREAGMNWLRDNGAESLIIETVNAQTLASYAKSVMEEEGKDLPHNLFKTNILTYTSITKAGVV